MNRIKYHIIINLELLIKDDYNNIRNSDTSKHNFKITE